MKIFITLFALVGYIAVTLGCGTSLSPNSASLNGAQSPSPAAAVASPSAAAASPSASAVTTAASAAPATGRVPKDDYVLALDSKSKDAPAAPFSHLTHSTKNYSIDGKGLITCVECHHTDQPKSALKSPYVSAFPADRTTTLTTDLLAKDPKAPDVLSCRACHEQTGAKPKSWPEIPKILYEGDTDPVVLNNEEAYHRNCNGCHDQALEARKTFITKAPPAGTACAECHTGKK